MKRFINKLVVGSCLCLASFVWADAPVADPVPVTDYAACLAQWDTKLATLQTQFIQTTEYDGMLISQSQGRISYQKNGPKLRLDNQEESVITQTALTNKKQIYILDDKGKEISKISWNDWLSGQPNQALFDFGNYTQLVQKHKVNLQSVSEEQAVLRLLPKTKGETYLLTVSVRTDDCFPQQITIENDLMKTTATLTAIEINISLPTDLFKRLK